MLRNIAASLWKYVEARSSTGLRGSAEPGYSLRAGERRRLFGTAHQASKRDTWNILRPTARLIASCSTDTDCDASNFRHRTRGPSPTPVCAIDCSSPHRFLKCAHRFDSQPRHHFCLDRPILVIVVRRLCSHGGFSRDNPPICTRCWWHGKHVRYGSAIINRFRSPSGH